MKTHTESMYFTYHLAHTCIKIILLK